MSFVITDTSLVFSNPVSVAAPFGANPLQIDASAGPVQLGGIGATYATQSSSGIQQVVLSGAATRVDLGAGAAKVQVIGGGNIVESAQAGNVAGSIISLGSSSVSFNGSSVNQGSVVSGNAVGIQASITEVSGGQLGTAAYYAHGGQGADLIEGSSLADFIRGGAGNDSINGFGGNDLIRGGAGSDVVNGGDGVDTLYYTSDQLDGSTDVFSDFVSGVDKIAVDSSAVSNIQGVGSNVVTLSGDSGSVTIVSGNNAIQLGDINFV